MRFTALCCLFLFLVVFSPLPLLAQDLDNPLPHNLTPAERELMEQNYDRYLDERYGDFDRLVDPRQPQGKIWCPGEFDQAEGVCYSWAGYSSLLTPLITESSQDVKVFIGVSSYNEDSVRRTLIQAGAKEENLNFISTRLDSVWMRDFGPYFIHTENGAREIIDCVYNRPRPNDDKFPTTLANVLNITAHPCRLIMPGGNFISDGHGVGLMTDVVFDPSQGGDSSMSVAKLEKYMKDYFGINRVIIIRDMNRDGTGHIDMFSKLLDDRNFIVGKYATPSDGASGNYQILEDNAKILANETNGLGQKFIVTRIPMPRYDGNSYSHTNSTIINNKVLVPTYNKGTDDEALAVYQKILPNHKIVGFNCNGIISANGAIHCITKLVMADPIDVKHTPPVVDIRKGESRFLRFRVKTTHPLDPEQVQVHWSRTPEGPFLTVQATKFRGDLWTAELPVQDEPAGDRYYFISAATEDGLRETSPLDAPTTVHTFKIQ